MAKRRKRTRKNKLKYSEKIILYCLGLLILLNFGQCAQNTAQFEMLYILQYQIENIRVF